MMEVLPFTARDSRLGHPLTCTVDMLLPSMGIEATDNLNLI